MSANYRLKACSYFIDVLDSRRKLLELVQPLRDWTSIYCITFDFQGGKVIYPMSLLSNAHKC